jgi:hypothetical protein
MRARALCWTLSLSAAVVAARAADIRPGDNLVVDGIPPIPDSLAEAVGRYTEFRSATPQGWHPVRREMLITTRFADTAQVHQVKMPGGDRRQLTFFPDRVAGASYQPTKGDYFILAKDTSGNEFRQLYRYDLPAGTITLLTDGKSQNGGVVWSTAGDRIAYGSTRRNGKDRDLYVQDPRQPASDRRLAEVEGGGWQPLDWTPDDTKILVLEVISANESYLWVLDAATGTKTLLTPRTDRRRSPTAAASSQPTAARHTSPPTATPSSSAWPGSTSPRESTRTSRRTSTGTWTPSPSRATARPSPS